MNAITWNQSSFNLSPWYEWGCMDNAHDYVNRIRILVRSWSTHAEFEEQLTGDPSASGFEPPPFDDSLLMDHQVWPAAGGGFDDTYPAGDL